MRRALRCAFLIAACAGITAQAAPAWMPHEGMRVEPRAQDRPTTKGLAHAGRLRSHHMHAVTLGPAPGAKTLTRPAKGAPLQVGFNRDVAPLATATLAAAALEWESLADGKHVAAIRIDSAGASALRAGLRIVDLPDDALLRFTDGSDSELFEVSGHDVNAALRRNADAGDAGGEAGLWWSPVIEGEAISIEVELDAARDPSAVRIAIPRVSHLFTSASNAFATPTTLGRSEACEVDASCSTDLPSEKNAVAEMVFSDSTGSFLCTGTLLADQDSATNAPYFLSANHCISSQGVASTLVTYWFYRSSACNSGAPGAYRQLTGGATLLYHTTATDTSFMRLNNTPPQGTYFAGWSTSATPSLGTAVTALHQPRGDLLKISKGQVGGFLTCTAPTNGGFSCSNASSASSTFYDVGWSRGVTEPGSSGSALFDGNYVVGQLYGGSGDCTTPGDDAYGRFDVAYRNALKTWLSPPLALTVARSGSGTGTVTSSPAGISCGATCSASFDAGTSVTLNASASAGSTFTGWTGACSGTGACTVAMGAATTVGATFQGNATLSVSTSGNGRVSSVPSGIDCGSACAATFATGTAVTLAATPSTGSVFKGWGGACSGTGSCAITLRGATSVTASFGAPSADVALAQSANPAAPIAGKDVVLDLVATNNGPDAASNVTIADAVPAGTQLVWLSPNCSQAGAAISCRIGTLASHASGNATVVVRPLAAGTLTHAASASAAEPDPAPADNASSTTLAVGAVAAGVPVPRYRLYSPITREHLFTTDLNEYQTLGAQAGTWVQEGLSGHVLDNPGSFNGVTAVPYYRLYNTTTWWHHWTTDANEYYTLTRAPNWNAEGIDGYILPTSTTGAEPLYRLLYPDGRGLHHWTIDADEYNILVGTYGWVGEGGSGFVIR